MAMNTHTLVNLCILSSASYLLILTSTVSSQKYSSMHKDYFFIKEQKTFDEAVSLCKSRGETLVEIKNQAENEFVWRTISQSADRWIWFGATNIIGTKQFKWLSDGSDVDYQYTNWYPSRPEKQVNSRKAIATYSNGKWYDQTVSNKWYVLCERDNVLGLQSKLTEHTDQSNAKFKQLDSQLEVTASTQRKEYLQLVLEVKKDYDRINDQLVNLVQVNGNNQQKDIIRKLEAQDNDMSTELEFQKHVITRLNTDVERIDVENKHLKSILNSNEKECSGKIISLRKDNDLLERRLNLLEQKILNNILDNSNIQ